nr:hypothetical protein [Porphyromonas gingivalis]
MIERTSKPIVELSRQLSTFFSTRHFGSGNEKFSHHNETILAPFFQKTRAAIGAFLVRVSMTAGYRHWRDRIDVGALW